jgi:hypothetical protein
MFRNSLELGHELTPKQKKARGRTGSLLALHTQPCPQTANQRPDRRSEVEQHLRRIVISSDLPASDSHLHRLSRMYSFFG